MTRLCSIIESRVAHHQRGEEVQVESFFPFDLFILYLSPRSPHPQDRFQVACHDTAQYDLVDYDDLPTR